MFSKKTLHITLAFVLLIGLASLGLTYGAWSQTLTVGGTVHTGSFDVKFMPLWYDDDAQGVATCAAQLSEDGHDITVTISNGYPGYFCEGGSAIDNLSSIPAKVHGLVKTSSDTIPFFSMYLTDAKGNQISTSGNYVLAAATYGGGIYWNFTIPATETGHMDESYSFTYTLLAEQAVP